MVAGFEPLTTAQRERDRAQTVLRMVSWSIGEPEQTKTCIRATIDVLEVLEQFQTQQAERIGTAE
jgi:hypothetical protein